MPTVTTATLTFLFTDIEDSTTRWEHRSQAMSAALVRHGEILRGAIESHDGHVFRIGGDAFCAAFGSAGDALVTAVQAQRVRGTALPRCPRV